MGFDVSGNESVILASMPAFLKIDPGITYYSFVDREKTAGLSGRKYALELISIHIFSWNSTPELYVSNLVRYRPFPTGPLSNAFDNLATTRTLYDSISFIVGDELFYFAFPESVSTFTIYNHRPIYRPDFQMFKNDVLVYTDASVATSAENPSPFRFTCNAS